MSMLAVCDICGEPIWKTHDGRFFKVKEAKFSALLEPAWIRIDCHNERMRILLEAAKERKEEGPDR